MYYCKIFPDIVCRALKWTDAEEAFPGRKIHTLIFHYAGIAETRSVYSPPVTVDFREAMPVGCGGFAVLYAGRELSEKIPEREIFVEQNALTICFGGFSGTCIRFIFGAFEVLYLLLCVIP